MLKCGETKVLDEYIIHRQNKIIYYGTMEIISQNKCLDWRLGIY